MTTLSQPCRTDTVDAVTLAQQLIRFDTTNPPGREADCIRFIDDLLTSAGIATQIIAKDPQRPNLIARLPGRGEAPPLLLHAHVDVVPTTGQSWSHPPFSGDLREEHVWGRGAIDMKGSLAAMLAALLRLNTQATLPAGDIILAVVADEENGSAVGARYLVQEHAHLFDHVAYAIGEDGGASLELDGSRRLHPIVVAEKRAVWLRATFRGPAGHASRIPAAHAAPRLLTRLLNALSDGGLGPEPSAVTVHMLSELAAAHPGPIGQALLRFRDDPADLRALDHLSERDALFLRSISQHTANPTVIRAGHKTNVIPGEISVDIDGRLLPGTFTTDDFIAALKAKASFPLDIDILVEGEAMPEPVLGPFYQRMAHVLRDADPDGIPVPMTTTASTDARLFPQLGIASYGFMPLLLPAGSAYRDLLHAPDERIPVDALHFATHCYQQLLLSYP
ncbi:M20/M25/M40 family metallo-hydrolase [Streptomyces sp. NPDC058268]|uniref:M20/M25/M40 family metallo-hydrolase n=1 Tax=Streptomyces sp. NPDC058268 TaxID=3346413 RepID=UPI0036EFC552